jgi:hypothetical protein
MQLIWLVIGGSDSECSVIFLTFDTPSRGLPFADLVLILQVYVVSSSGWKSKYCIRSTCRKTINSRFSYRSYYSSLYREPWPSRSKILCISLRLSLIPIYAITKFMHGACTPKIWYTIAGHPRLGCDAQRLWYTKSWIQNNTRAEFYVSWGWDHRHMNHDCLLERTPTRVCGKWWAQVLKSNFVVLKREVSDATLFITCSTCWNFMRLR